MRRYILPVLVLNAFFAASAAQATLIDNFSQPGGPSQPSQTDPPSPSEYPNPNTSPADPSIFGGYRYAANGPGGGSLIASMGHGNLSDVRTSGSPTLELIYGGPVKANAGGTPTSPLTFTGPALHKDVTDGGHDNAFLFDGVAASAAPGTVLTLTVMTGPGATSSSWQTYSRTLTVPSIIPVSGELAMLFTSFQNTSSHAFATSTTFSNVNRIELDIKLPNVSGSQFQFGALQTAPEPSTCGLLAVGVGLLGGWKYRRRKSS